MRDPIQGHELRDMLANIRTHIPDFDMASKIMCLVNAAWNLPPPIKAVEVPLNDCGLSINYGRDGAWLHFSASNGKKASISVNCLAVTYPDSMRDTLFQWADDLKTGARFEATHSKGEM